MPDFVPFAKQPSYPHMRPADVVIWESFLAAYPDAYKEVAYDVMVGDVPDFVMDATDDVGSNITTLYKWKIDVLAKRGGGYDVIEIKPAAGASAIGQVICYDVLLDDVLGDGADTTPVLLTDSVRPNMPRLCAHHGVRLLVV